MYGSEIPGQQRLRTCRRESRLGMMRRMCGCLKRHLPKGKPEGRLGIDCVSDLGDVVGLGGWSCCKERRTQQWVKKCMDFKDGGAVVVV